MYEAVTDDVPAAPPPDLTILAHDLRTPLQTINFCCDLIAGAAAEDDDTRTMLLGVIRETVSQIGGIIGDVLDPAFSGDAAAAAASSPAAAVSSVLREVVERHRALGRINGVQVEYLDAPAAEALIEAARLQRALGNLLTNAVRHTPPGGRVLVSAKAVADDVWIFVADTGAGIPRERLARLFEQPAPSAALQGGYGLRIVKRIIDDAGGRISVTSSEGLGTTFTVILPSRRNPPRGADPARGTPARRWSDQPSGGREVTCRVR
jgi:two-component system, OmpR family, sensor histidine kinase BaeS